MCELEVKTKQLRIYLLKIFLSLQLLIKEFSQEVAKNNHCKFSINLMPLKYPKNIMFHYLKENNLKEDLKYFDIEVKSKAI